MNYKNVLKAIERITAEDGLGMSPRRITVSTAGVAKQIRQLGDDKVRFKLALSLHAANDTKRNEIMPINETNNLAGRMLSLNELQIYQSNKNNLSNFNRRFLEVTGLTPKAFRLQIQQPDSRKARSA